MTDSTPGSAATGVVIRAPHADLGDDDYHQWVTLGGRVKADVNGRRQPRIWNADWQRWVCNNTECPAVALVSDAAIVALLT